MERITKMRGKSESISESEKIIRLQHASEKEDVLRGGQATLSEEVTLPEEATPTEEVALTEEAILLEDVVKLDGNSRRVINGFSLRIFKGESVGISGAAGSGKTCLTRLIAGMEPPDSGSITVLGKPIHRMTADAAAKFRNLHIGLVSQYPGFLRRLAVLENVAMPLTLRGVALSIREKAAKERLQMLGLLYAAQARPSQLSLLELQTAAIARALVHRPGILLLDDMEAELSQRDRETIADLLRKIRKLEQVTIVALTSSNNSILDTDRMLHLADGKAYIVDHC